ncbi:MAG: TylF/MycF/NovP-related O-methyltransferase [Planctomycetota bacterium]|nr:TylF/MycF/NovP-related O-methyltransferase [Planctomycetota bacterium]
MKGRPENLYIDLMKKTLAFTLWTEPPIPLYTFNYQRPPVQRILVSSISRILRSKQLQLVKQRDFTTDQKEEGKIWPGYAYTMIGLKRLDNIQFCVETVIREGAYKVT